MSSESYADGQLQVAVDGPIGTIALNRPGKRNAMTQAMWQAFPVALQALNDASDVKVIVLMSSTPGFFCAGADIDEFAAFARDPTWRQANHRAIGQTQLALARAPKPTIAQIAGVCVGGSCGLANACDFRIAASDARLGITPAKLGLVYSLHDTKLLVDLVGASAAKLVLFTGRLFTAEQALAMGWVNGVVALPELASEVKNLALEMAQNSQHSIHHAKTIVRDIQDGVSADDANHVKLFFDAFDGADHQAGVDAFLAKRKPVF